jgi:hypothetical protein
MTWQFLFLIPLLIMLADLLPRRRQRRERRGFEVVAKPRKTKPLG